jgi:hypothetical protein
MRAALTEVIGAEPHSAVLALALAKTALETGRWRAMWNFNFGNVKCSDRWAGLFTCISLNEVGKAGVTWYAPEGELNRKGGQVIGSRYDVPPGHPQTRMRAFSTADDGALDYVRFVAGGRYAAAWMRLLDGDAAGYVHELKRAGYFTADEAPYARGVVALQREFLAKLKPETHAELDPSEVHEVPEPDVVRGWLAPMDIAQLEAELADRYFDLLDMSRRDGHREMSEGAP